MKILQVRKIDIYCQSELETRNRQLETRNSQLATDNHNMLSNKSHIRNLVEICALKGIEQVIISPGSRNAPLVISFSEHGQFDCLSIPDERVAGFFALGIAQQTRKPVIITCTSGTAS